MSLLTGHEEWEDHGSLGFKQWVKERKAKKIKEEFEGNRRLQITV